MKSEISAKDLQSAAIADQQAVTSAIYKAPPVQCSECGSKIFHEAVVLKKVSMLLSGTGKEELVPIPVYVCDKCGKIPDEFLNKPAAKYILGNADDNAKEETTDNSLTNKK